MLPHALVGDFIDAVVQDQERAARLLGAHPELLNARWIHDETALHFLAIEGFLDGVTFLAERGAAIDATNEFGDTALIDVCVLQNAEMAAVLLRFGANPNAMSRHQGQPAPRRRGVRRRDPGDAAARRGRRCELRLRLGNHHLRCRVQSRARA